MEKQNLKVSSRGIIRNWCIRVNDITRLLINNGQHQEGVTQPYIEIRYNNTVINSNERILDILSYPADKIVRIFYKILKCIDEAKSQKNSDDYLIILDDDIMLLSNTNIIE